MQKNRCNPSSDACDASFIMDTYLFITHDFPSSSAHQYQCPHMKKAREKEVPRQTFLSPLQIGDY
jgi:hypothetical protein